MALLLQSKNDGAPIPEDMMTRDNMTPAGRAVHVSTYTKVYIGSGNNWGYTQRTESDLLVARQDATKISIVLGNNGIICSSTCFCDGLDRTKNEYCCAWVAESEEENTCFPCHCVDLPCNAPEGYSFCFLRGNSEDERNDGCYSRTLNVLAICMSPFLATEETKCHVSLLGLLPAIVAGHLMTGFFLFVPILDLLKVLAFPCTVPLCSLAVFSRDACGCGLRRCFPTSCGQTAITNREMKHLFISRTYYRWEEIIIGDICLSDDGVSSVVYIISHSNKLKVFKLHPNRLTDEGHAQINQALILSNAPLEIVEGVNGFDFNERLRIRADLERDRQLQLERERAAIEDEKRKVLETKKAEKQEKEEVNIIQGKHWEEVAATPQDSFRNIPQAHKVDEGMFIPQAQEVQQETNQQVEAEFNPVAPEPAAKRQHGRFKYVQSAFSTVALIFHAISAIGSSE